MCIRDSGYRIKEKLPLNLGEFTVPIGKVEFMSTGEDITVVSYGSTLRIVQSASKKLLNEGISVELIDVQSLIPTQGLQIHYSILRS